MVGKYVVEIVYEDGCKVVEEFERKEDLYDRFRDKDIDYEGFTDSLYYSGEVEYYDTYKLLTGLPYEEPHYLVRYFEEHRDGSLEGLFICTEKELGGLNSVTVHFGEVLGKHSDVSSDTVYENCVVLSSNQDALRDLEVLFGRKTISGTNPLNYLGEMEDEGEGYEQT